MKAFRRMACILALPFLFLLPVSAESMNLTLDDAVQLAVKENISIAESKITVDAAKRSYDHAWNSLSPSVSVTAGAASPNDKSSYDYSAYVQGSLSLSFSPSLFTSIKTAQLNYESGQITYEAACRSVELNVRTVFYNLLYQEEYIALEQNSLESAKKQYEQNLAKYKQGALAELDVLSSQVSYEAIKPTLQSAQVTYANNLASFKQVLSLDQNTDLVLSGSLDDILALGNITLDDVVSDSPDVKALEKKLEIAQNAVAAAKSSAYGPTVSAGFTYQPTVTNKSSGLSDSGSLSLTVSIPLDSYLPWSSGADSIATAEDTVKDLELQLKDEKTTVQVNTQNYLNQIQQAQSAIASLKANVDLAQKTYDLTLAAYNHGTKDLLALQDASDSLMTAKVNLKSEAYTLVSAILNLENTLGVPFGTLGK